MQITLTFDGVEEFCDQIQRFAALNPKPAKSGDSVTKVVEDWEKAKAEKKTAKKEAPAPAPAPEPEKAPEKPAPEPEAEKPAAEITEDYRLEVRQVLCQLKKKHDNDKKVATEIIKSFGVDRLSEVPLNDLPALMAKAKEALDA